MKKVPVVKITTPDAAVELAGLPLEATVAMADVAAAMREGLLAFSAAAGLVVMQQMLTEELASIVGSKHARLGAGRVGNWHGTTTGQVVLGSQKVTVSRPRARFVDGGEVELATWETFASEDLLRQVVVERMLAGVATRRHVDVTEPIGPVEGRATSKSAVWRRFKAATEAALSELLARDLSELNTAVLMIDGLNVAGQMITVALIICADGTKVPVGLVLGDTENTVVVTDLLADLVARGLRYDHGILAVLDGSKALRKAVVKVFGERALIQRCTLHKRRNVIGYLPVDERDAIDRRLGLAFAQPDPVKGLKACRDLARQLEAKHPDAAPTCRRSSPPSPPPRARLLHPPTTLRSPEQVRDHHRLQHGAGHPHTATLFEQACKTLAITQSMGRAGSCFDNAAAESSFSTVEWELFRKRRFETKQDARREVAWFIDWYNRVRRHSSCEMKPPIEFEAILAAKTLETLTEKEAA